MPPKTVFGLVRHAETEWNRAKRIQGQQDAPLTTEGRACSQKWGRQLAPYKWDFLLASDLGRACETAMLINATLRIPLQTDAGLREQHWGDWTARPIKELKVKEADRLAVLEAAGWGFAPPGGESRRQVRDRSLVALLTAARNWPGKRIIVVCHEGVVKCLIYHLTGRRFLSSEGRLLKPRHLHLISERDGHFGLDQVNALDLRAPV